MIETVLITYLGAALSVPVFMEVPEDPPASFVVLEKTGGGMENHIQRATVAIQAYGPTLYDAIVLNERIKTAMLYGETPPEIAGVRLNSDYNYTDPTTKRYRYQAVYDITYY